MHLMIFLWFTQCEVANVYAVHFMHYIDFIETHPPVLLVYSRQHTNSQLSVLSHKTVSIPSLLNTSEFVNKFQVSPSAWFLLSCFHSLVYDLLNARVASNMLVPSRKISFATAVATCSVVGCV